MSETVCTFGERRDETIVAYMYDDLEPAERAGFESHAARCAACRAELDDLGAVRGQLARWTPPPVAGFTFAPPAPGARVWAVLREMPAWMQVAAALLVLGVSAGAANLEIRYDRAGLSVRTGWSGPAGADESAVIAAAPWRADLAALERQLRGELRAAALPLAAAPEALGAADVDRRVRALVAESERRQQRELALRIADALREMQVQRRGDLERIDRSLGAIQDLTGMEAMRQRQMLNNLAVRVSQRQ